MAVAAAQLPHPTAHRRPALRLVASQGRTLAPAPRAARPAVPAPAPSAAVLRRRRVLVAALSAVAVLAVALGVVALWPSPSIAEQVAEPAPEVVVVSEGETVWDLVAPHVPAGTDRMAYVTEVVAANGVDGRRIAPGTALTLP